METVGDFIFLGSKITADGDLSHEIKRCLLLGRKVMTNLDSILKSRDITLPTKVYLVKAKGSCQEELPPVRGQGQRPRVPDCDGAGTAERSYPASEVRGGGQEELPHV